MTSSRVAMRTRPGRAVLALVLACVTACSPSGGSDAPIQARLSVGEAMSGGDDRGFARVEAARELVFPVDHGPHPEFRAEWWYYTGNLRTADGRHFGFQLTFFRRALVAEAVPRASAWGAHQLYLAHFALTDTNAGRFRAWSRASREALGLAGAAASPFRVWLDDWEAASTGPRGLPMRLRAAEDDVALELSLDGGKPVVLQGDRGVSRKGPEPGNASVYYSLTRMPARGTIRIAGERFEVTGLAWMDREWGTTTLSPGVAGWDWFALQLDDGRDIMLYRLRRTDGTASEWSAGAVVAPDGTARRVGADGVGVEALGAWTSARSGVRYPAGWRVTMREPGERAVGLALELHPRLPDQELDVDPRYWEGAVTVRGSEGGRVIGGEGYVELVGYPRAAGAAGR